MAKGNTKVARFVGLDVHAAWSYPVSVDRFGLVSWVTPKCLDSYPIGDS